MTVARSRCDIVSRRLVKSSDAFLINVPTGTGAPTLRLRHGVIKDAVGDQVTSIDRTFQHGVLRRRRAALLVFAPVRNGIDHRAENGKRKEKESHIFRAKSEL